MTAENPHVSIECHVRPPVALESVENVIETLHEYEQKDVVDELSIDMWPHEICLTGDIPVDFVLDRYERFREWADGEGVSLEPAFEVRRRSTLDSDDTDAFLVLPVLCLAIHVDGTLVSVAPHRTETGTHTVEDALTHIESMPRIREVGNVSELPPDHPARSVSVSKRS